MATIREELVLYDKFSSTFARLESMCQGAESALNDVRYSMANIETATAATATAMQQMTRRTETGARRAAASTDALTRSVKRLAAAVLSSRAVKGIFSLSDAMTSTTARLDMMNDGLQTTAELNDMIFASAQRSRGAYQ